MDVMVVLEVVALALVPVGAYTMMWFLVFAPGRYRQAACAVLTVPYWLLRRRTGGLRRRGRTTAVAHAPAVDPFAALGVQFALGRLTAELEALAADDQVFARGIRVAATQAAYDDVLEQACVLAQVPRQRDKHDNREVTRLIEEAALAERGWTW